MLIDKRINEWLNDLGLIGDFIKRIFEGGKRFRSLLTILVGESLNIPCNETLDYATAIEFIHNATLIHDDIIDKHELRRGKTSLWKILGLHDAIIFGDVLFSYAGYKLSKISLEALNVLSNTIYLVTKGVYMETHPLEVHEKTSDLYLLINRFKTAELFGAATKLGSLPVDDEALQEDAYMYGIALGEAYQLADDLVDVKALLNGSKNLDLKPIKLLIAFLSKDDKLLKELFEENITVEVMRTYIVELKADEQLKELIDEKLEITAECLSGFPENKLKMYLKAMPKLMVEAMINEAEKIRL